MSSVGLYARAVCKEFGGVRALAYASVSVQPGYITGLIGRNGSGKSTLFNCITGFLRPDEGQIIVDGRDITGMLPQQVVGSGVARTFQTPRVDPRVRVREAVACGFFGSRAGFLSSLFGTLTARREEQRIWASTEQLMHRLNLLSWQDHEVGQLSMGLVRLVEVARAMAAGARYLLLDEPAAGLTPQEQSVLGEQIRAVADSGVGVLLVEHHFAFIRELCTVVTVLDFGRVLREGTPSEIAKDPQVVATYLGAVEVKVFEA